MTMTEFSKGILYLSAAIGKEIPDGGTEPYFDLLGDLPYDDFLQACRVVILQHVWATFPTVAELLAIFAFRWEAKASILVDDAHFFQPSFWRQRRRSRGYDIAQWPRQELLRATVEEFGYSMRAVGDVFAIEKER